MQTITTYTSRANMLENRSHQTITVTLGNLRTAEDVERTLNGAFPAKTLRKDFYAVCFIENINTAVALVKDAGNWWHIISE